MKRSIQNFPFIRAFVSLKLAGVNLSSSYRFFSLLVSGVVCCIWGCQKEDEPTGNEEVKYQLKKVEYKTWNAVGVYTYNADSTLKQIVYSGGGSGSYTMDIAYHGKEVIRTSLSNSLYKTNYHYNNAGKMSSVFQGFNGEENRGLKFDYSYNANGSVAQMKYSNVNEAGEHLVYTNTYEYDAGGELKTIRSASGNSVIIFTIDSYSKECSFNIWTYAGAPMSELYVIYNYPVLNTLKKLPEKITKNVVLNGGTPTIENIFETEFLITGKKLEKTISSVIYPQNPDHNTSSEVLYTYY